MGQHFPVAHQANVSREIIASLINAFYSSQRIRLLSIRHRPKRSTVNFESTLRKGGIKQYVVFLNHTKAYSIICKVQRLAPQICHLKCYVSLNARHLFKLVAYGHFYHSNNHCKICEASGINFKLILFTEKNVVNGSMPKKSEKNPIFWWFFNLYKKNPVYALVHICINCKSMHC